MPPFRPGDKLQHLYDRDLGPGEVLAVGPRRMTVRFPRSGQELVFSVADHPFAPLQLPQGAGPSDWHAAENHGAVERLARLDTDPVAAWSNRWEGFRLGELREAHGLGAHLGGRIELFPHQLHVAEQACARDPVRWLLADEVGLGKTVEACLVLNRLLRTGRAERVLVVAPASLTVQWLGELYRKFHQTFALLDGARRKDVRRDFGPEFNPFDAHPHSVVALEDLVAAPDLAAQALDAAPDLLVVDEAHHLARRPGHPGNAAYRSLAPVCAASRHALLLTATPLEADAHGFFRLLELLRPDVFHCWDAFRADLDSGTPIYPCASATRRNDIGGLPPRVPCPVPLPPCPAQERALDRERAKPAANPLQRRRRAAAVERLLGAPSGGDDPRLGWLAEQARAWGEAGDKGLVFVHRRDSLEVVKRELEGATRRRVAVFHDDMSPAARDLEVARFADAAGPTLMIATETGGEGRNFAFCRGVVLFDLPWNPVLVEQRIGRLDRISRKRPVEIHYFVPAAGFGTQVARLYEALGIFREPLGGLDHALGHVAESIVAALDTSPPQLDSAQVVAETTALRRQISQALHTHLHRDRYRPELGEAILARVPQELDALTSRVVLEACRQYGFEMEPKEGTACWYLEFGTEATVEHLPGVAEGSRWLGTFDRAEAVARETLDYFSAGHPLVEAVLLELADGHRGQVGLLDVPGTGEEGFGLLALVRQGMNVVPVLLDLGGNPRPEWHSAVLREPPLWRTADLGDWGLGDGAEARATWSARVRDLLNPLRMNGALLAAAGLRLLP
ncbi:MAG TPA: helicase-related protein [Deferrisomatales bacterium]|nr:helicase-related protein [Deferrisomatales bacterium]